MAAAGLWLDLWSKDWAFRTLDPRPVSSAALEVIPNVMTFRRSLNAGALFGLGKGLTPIFIIASFLAFGFVLYLFMQSDCRRRSLHVALGLVLAGALGNLYDRIFMQADVVTFTTSDGRTVTEAYRLIEISEEGVVVASWPDGQYPHLIPARFNPRVRQQGVVRDFIKMEPRFRVGERTIEIWPWVFNIADCLLVIGVGLLMLNFWWDRQAEKAVAGRPAPESSPGG